jgi:hypothetical protein
MAYDEDLANRNMAVGLMGDELMVRLAPADGDAALDESYTRPFDMTGRPMRGWIVVAPAGIATDEQLRDWVRRGVAFARSLPPRG